LPVKILKKLKNLKFLGILT